MSHPEVPASRPAESPAIKPWKKYSFEFLLIFLAVFLGFVAENLREESVEKQHAHELARSFYEELKNDSVVVAQKIQGRIVKEQALRYMVNFFRDSSLTSSSKALSINFIHAITARTPIIFTPRTVVLNQLRTSESLRYFKNAELQRLIGDLFVAIEYIHVRQDYENAIFYSHIEPIMINHMDYEFQFELFSGDKVFERLAEYEKNDEYIPFHLSQVQKINRQVIINTLGYYHTNGLMSTRLIPFQKYQEANTALLRELRKEYGLR